MWEKELAEMISVAPQAAKIIMDVYHTKFDVEIKNDNSPVTNADKKSDELIRNYLSKKFPSYSFLTEESGDNHERLKNDCVFIVDPLDGTKDFVAHDDMFTINIGFSYRHEVVAGVVMIPATDEMYYASKGNGAFYSNKGKVKQIHVNDKLNNLLLLTSVFHTTDNVRQIIKKNEDKIKEVKAYGSSIKACLIARGEAEVSFSLSPNTKEWDTAASQIIVEEAGGIFAKPNGDKIVYNREDVYNREGFVTLNRIENNFAK